MDALLSAAAVLFGILVSAIVIFEVLARASGQ